MRKLLALLLSVLMLASSLAAIPAFAADEADESYDGTTKDTVNKILITEIGRKMYYHTNRGNDGDEATHLGAMNFVEIYNNGAGDVDLTSLSLVLGVDLKKEPEIEGPYNEARTQGLPLWSEWSVYHRFISKMDIKQNALLDAETAQKYIDISSTDDLTEKLYNDYLTNKKEDMTLSDGENAVIWLVTPKTIEWLAWGYKTKGVDFDPKAEFLKSAGVPAVSGKYNSYTVVMVWAYSDYAYTVNEGVFGKSAALAKDMFNFENVPDPDKTLDMNYILGVAKSTWNVDETQAYTVDEEHDTTTINEDLYCVSVLGSLERDQKYVAMDDFTVTYAPAAAEPFVQNAQNAYAGGDTKYDDYFDAGIVKSYRETGVIQWMSKPTPGMMPDWQWAVVDPTNEKAPAAVKAEGGVDAVINKYLKEDLLLNEESSNAGRDESGIDHNYNFESQEDIKNRFNNTKKKDTTDDGRLPTWALILIIVGGVLVVAGGACAVVFLVILPKKKAAAASVDAALAEDAPVEEAPAEEAPAAEDNKEE